MISLKIYKSFPCICNKFPFSPQCMAWKFIFFIKIVCVWVVRMYRVSMHTQQDSMSSLPFHRKYVLSTSEGKSLLSSRNMAHHQDKHINEKPEKDF